MLLCMLEVPEELEVMRRMLITQVSAVEGIIVAIGPYVLQRFTCTAILAQMQAVGAGGARGVGGDALYATLYVGGCVLFAGGVEGVGGAAGARGRALSTTL